MERARGAAQEPTDPHLEQAKKLAESTLRTTRDIAMGLRPTMLDVLGLGPALEWQAREFTRRYHTPIHLEMDGDLETVPDPHRTYLYRIVQEGLTNCARHAQAKNIRVRSRMRTASLRSRLRMTASDSIQHAGVVYGLGLLGMRSACASCAGRSLSSSQPGQGTRIAVTLPLKPAGENPTEESSESSPTG